MADLVFLDGKFLPRQRAHISVQDRGFLFGDGVYEMIRASGGRMFEPDRHLERLESGLRALRIGVGTPSRYDLLEIARRLLEGNGLLAGDATVYLQITRGAAVRRHNFPPDATPATVFVSAATFLPLEELRHRGGSAITQPDTRWSRCHLKTVNLLPNVLAKQAAVEADVTEAVFVRDGFITEGSSTNVFGARDGELFTHPTSNHILPGITRAVVLELAAEIGLRVRETPILAAEARDLDEMFITGTTTDVLPIVRLDGRPVAGGVPGPIALLLQERLAERLEGPTRPLPLREVVA
jgi:D-alanine transaminase